MIYVLRSGDAFKVGYTLDLERRMKTYKTHNPNYSLEFTFPGGPSLEAFLHKGLRDYRIVATEWFNCFEGYLETLQCLRNVYHLDKTVTELPLPFKAINKLKHAPDIKLFLTLVEEFGAEGVVFMSPRVRAKLCQELSISPTNIAKNFKRLEESGLLKFFEGDYTINLVGTE